MHYTWPTSNSVTVWRSYPFTTYIDISVQACSICEGSTLVFRTNWEGSSCGVLITTLCAVPGTIRGLMVSTNTSLMLQFTWQRSFKPNFPLFVYKLMKVVNVTQPSTMLTVDVSDPGADFGSCATTVHLVLLCYQGNSHHCPQGNSHHCPQQTSQLSNFVYAQQQVISRRPPSVGMCSIIGQLDCVVFTDA